MEGTEPIIRMEQQSYKYFAFISYSAKDTEWGKRLQRKLEHYRLPSALCSEHGWKRTPIKPVFFAPTDIQPGDLTEEIQERLRVSKHLIVICSPYSAQSKWVGKEIEFFHQLGRIKQIHFFIVKGTPHSGNANTDCFNPIIDVLELPEILGANIHEKIYRFPWLNKERAYVQLVSKLLSIEYDTLWQRHRRLIKQKMAAWTSGIIVLLMVIMSIWQANRPIDIFVKLNESTVHNQNLPPLHDAVISMILDNETKNDTVKAITEVASFKNIPHRLLKHKIRLLFECSNFYSLDTLITLQKSNHINISRDPVPYGKVYFRLWNPVTEKTAANTEITIDNHLAVSNSDGYVALSIPLEEQKTEYTLESSLKLINTTLYLPCGTDDVVLFE